jgi:hypothetical protein
MLKLRFYVKKLKFYKLSDWKSINKPLMNAEKRRFFWWFSLKYFGEIIFQDGEFLKKLWLKKLATDSTD